MAGERTEQASPRRRQKAREQGDRPHSRELSAGAAFLAGTLAVGLLAPHWVSGWREAYQRFLLAGVSPDVSLAEEQTSGLALLLQLRSIAVELMLPVCVVLLASFFATLIAGAGQGGGLGVHIAALQPKWTRLDPVSNLKNLFSLRSGLRFAKSLLPAGLLALLAWKKLAAQTELPVFSMGRVPKTFSDVYDLLADAAWVLCIWAALDFVVEWRSWTQRLRMSKQELREESKDAEGNPHVRGRIRSIQRQMRARNLRAEVARASVVITNPTHYAVALSFDFSTMDPPQVLTKGRNLVAEQIKSEARWAGVPIVENPPLARSLYRTVEAGQAIPFQLYAAVAGILAYLYRQQVEAQMRKQRQAADAVSHGPMDGAHPERHGEVRTISFADVKTEIEAHTPEPVDAGLPVDRNQGVLQENANK